jgi:multiple sugar transport system permease protein
MPASARASAAVSGRRTGTALLLMAPFFVLFVLTMLLPIGIAAYLSLFRQKAAGLGFGVPRTVFAGLSNFREVLSDPAYRDSYLHIAIFVGLEVPLVTASAVVIALLLDSVYARAKRFLQLGLFVPYLVPGVIAAILWSFLYTPQVSPVAEGFRHLGLHLDFFSPSLTYPVLVNILLWESLGYFVIIYFASLQAVPREVLEAAAIDGASEWRCAWHVKLPLIRGAVGLTALFSIIWGLQLFAEPLVISPSAAAITSSWSPNLYSYNQAFHNLNFGLASASALLLALFAAILSFVFTRVAKPWQV